MSLSVIYSNVVEIYWSLGMTEFMPSNCEDGLPLKPARERVSCVVYSFILKK